MNEEQKKIIEQYSFTPYCADEGAYERCVFVDEIEEIYKKLRACEL